jgi:hypothetical protein
MYLLQMLYDLLTAIPFWLLLGFIFCVVKLRRKTENQKTYKRWCLVLGIVNLFLIGLPFNAILFSGPLRGVVVDQITGKPIPGVRVTASWSRAGKIPVRAPWWGYLLSEATRLPCEQFSVVMLTDDEGKFHSNAWYGAKVWHGCQIGSYSTEMQGYDHMHRDKNGQQVFYRTFWAARIALSREAPEGQGQGY